MKATTAAFLTETTCGEACWKAREDICHCSCGGKNHGILRDGKGEQPLRTCKIDGYRYELLAVGSYDDIHRQAEGLLKSIVRDEETVKATGLDPATGEWVEKPLVYRYYWRSGDAGSPYRVKTATPQQAAVWPELRTVKDLCIEEWRRVTPCLLWKLIGKGALHGQAA